MFRRLIGLVALGVCYGFAAGLVPHSCVQVALAVASLGVACRRSAQRNVVVPLAWSFRCWLELGYRLGAPVCRTCVTCGT